MTKLEAVSEFKEIILPSIVETYEADGIRDIPARSEAWNDWTDLLCKSGRITDHQYDTWVHPACCNYAGVE